MSEKIQSTSDPPLQPWLQGLTPSSTLRELPAFDVTVPPDLVTSIVDRELGQSPDLPGVVIANDGELLGMISRSALLAQLSRPFGQELYLKRPIRLLLEADLPEPLVLPAGLLVSDAAYLALQRPADSVYEPVVARDGQQFRLLDAHTLLLAQSRLLALANETIRDHAATAESANRAKSIFLANMSHEIRTPLTAILGFAENLLDTDSSAQERTTAIETILRNGHHLLQLINDILDLSKIEADRLEVERLQLSPGELISDVISALKVRADAKKIVLNVVYDSPIPETIQSDPMRLRQILINLVSNAIKFTERGQVVVRMKMVGGAGDRHSSSDGPPALRLRFAVVDSGIGMTSDQLGRLFSPFVQADESMARRFGGTGLGLSISRRLARLLGGDIQVSSEHNAGSTFTLSVETGPLEGVAWQHSPLAPDSSRSTTAGSTGPRVSGRILLAEDGPDNQLLIGSFLRKQGADVTIVDNGQKAVEAAMDSLREDSPFRIVLMDMQMPVLDGYAATIELRSRGWTRPILALTANAMQGDRQRCLEAGCNDFATKPINRTELIEQIQFLTANELPTDTTLNGDSAPREDVLDLSAARNQVGGDDDLLHEIAGVFLRITPEWLKDLRRYLDLRDESSVRRTAHSLKNSAENIGGHRAASVMLKLEVAAVDSQFDQAESLWPQCQQEYEYLLEAVDAELGAGKVER